MVGNAERRTNQRRGTIGSRRRSKVKERKEKEKEEKVKKFIKKKLWGMKELKTKFEI